MGCRDYLGVRPSDFRLGERQRRLINNRAQEAPRASNDVATWLYQPFLGKSIVDPFMGSGRLLMPAIECGAEVIGIEIEERYCELAVKKFQRLLLSRTVATADFNLEMAP
jgi:2-polyprenyl-3-methyl-5-hydroxy-6-metoxy-1,4-benzoquinol methylase